MSIRSTFVLLALLVLAGCSKKGGETAAPPPSDAATPSQPAPRTDPQATQADATPDEGDAGAATAATPDGQDAASKGGKDDENAPLEDIKVLPKSWDRAKVKSYMKETVAKALGVKCKHCHDVDDYAKDNKKKTIARDMLRMTDRINHDFFRGKTEVTCMTCHIGHKEPPK